MIVPHGFDQFHWGRCVHDLGLAPPPLKKTQLTAERLAEALRIATTDEVMRKRARELASRLTTNGVDRVIERMEAAVNARQQGGTKGRVAG